MAIDFVGERNSARHDFVLVLSHWEVRTPLSAIREQRSVWHPASPYPDIAGDGLLECGLVNHLVIES